MGGILGNSERGRPCRAARLLEGNWVREEEGRRFTAFREVNTSSGRVLSMFL